MTHSYLILAHKNPTQLCRLVKNISGDNVYKFIHIDAKENIQPFVDVLSEYKNIYFCSNRISVNWGGFSMIEATLELMHLMLNTLNTAIDYVHLISGQDFPIKHPLDLDVFLKRYMGKNFIEYVTLPKADWSLGGMDRIQYHWDIDNLGIEASKQAIRNQPIRKYISNITPYGGSQWWTLTGECVEWLTTQCVEGNEIYDFYKSTIYPDEMLIQTLLMASPFKETLINSNLHKIDWIIPGPYPHIWLQNDLVVLKKTSKFFARKFDQNVDSKILNSIEHHIGIPQCNIHPIISLILFVLEEDNRFLNCIQNILKQTFFNFELIIITNEANSLAISEIQDSRITFIGNSCSTPKLESILNGEFIVKVSIDKVLFPEYLEILYEFMISNANIDVCGSWFENTLPTDISKFETEHNKIILQMLEEDTIYNTFSMIRKKSTYNEIVLEMLKSDTNNYDFWITLYECGAQFGIIQNIHFKLDSKYKKHSSFLFKKELMNRVIGKIEMEQKDFAAYLQESFKLYKEKLIPIETIKAVLRSIPKL